MTVRAATTEDLPAIAAIQALTPEASQWDPVSYLHHDCMVATASPDAGEGPRVLGFLVTRQTAPGEREILNLAVEASERRRGVARALLQAELGRGENQWFLEVRESNSRAIKLYESVGFRVAGRRESYYHDPPETGIVMKFVS
jgi:[ribosomal protein S18]-alanine N-acetyltransferase